MRLKATTWITYNLIIKLLYHQSYTNTIIVPRVIIYDKKIIAIVN